MLFETHCHLTDKRFDPDRTEAIERAREAGVGRIVTIASSADDAHRVAELTRSHTDVWGTAGVHPHEAADAKPGDLSRIRDLLDAEPRLVAIGETGLDYHYDFSPRDRQRESFQAHARLAADKGYPLVVHSRSADDDMRAMIADLAGSVAGVLHCYTGGMKLLEDALEAGWHISFTGLVTFKNFDGLAALRAVPSDRLMIETDSPYLAPVPNRRKRNEPAFVTLVRDAVAACRGERPEEIEQRSTATANHFFRLESDESETIASSTPRAAAE